MPCRGGLKVQVDKKGWPVWVSKKNPNDVDLYTVYIDTPAPPKKGLRQKGHLRRHPLNKAALVCMQDLGLILPQVGLQKCLADPKFSVPRPTIRASFGFKNQGAKPTPTSCRRP